MLIYYAWDDVLRKHPSILHSTGSYYGIGNSLINIVVARINKPISSLSHKKQRHQRLTLPLPRKRPSNPEPAAAVSFCGVIPAAVRRTQVCGYAVPGPAPQDAL